MNVGLRKQRHTQQTRRTFPPEKVGLVFFENHPSKEEPSQAFASQAATYDAPDGDGPNEWQSDDKVNLPVGDIDKMHEAIPYLPLPISLFCFVLNCSIPGTGTVLSGMAGMCIGQPRLSANHERRLRALIINVIVGISQFATVPFFLVGWFWSLAWGFQFIIYSMQYREALQARRKAAVATAAIEALARDSVIRHQKDVRNLIKGKDKK